ncbi:MAG: hypothetical protein H0X18_11255 [Geodermatophilaceae bacterium]|nr:hypothetical protein [Geodermatophilaceae bacterium]
MLRDGPIPRFVHGILEYALGVLFIAAPFLFDFDSGAATGMSVAVGVLILILAAVSEGPVSLVNQLPVLLHVAMIYLLSIFLIASPFLLGFSDEVPPRNFFIISGVLLLLITIGTRFRRSEPEPIGRKEPTRAASPSPQSTRSDDGPPPAPDLRTPPPGSMPAAPGMLPPVPPQSSPGARPRSQQTWTDPDSGGTPQP